MERSRTIPAPGEAPMPAPDAAALLRRNGIDPAFAGRPAIRFDDETWTHGQYFEECLRWAALFATTPRHPDAPAPHIAVLLDNTPEYLFALGGAALAGAAVVGLNHTRQGEPVRRDIEHTHCVLVVTEPRHLPTVEAIGGDLPPVLVVGEDLAAALAAADPTALASAAPGPERTWALIFTSGTSAAPKAVICSQRRILTTGSRIGIIMDVGPDDVGYVCMPLFHSNAVLVGWAPSIVTGASVALAPRFSSSQWLADVRRYGATYFGYTGKPLSYLLATPERPDDADNPLRVAFGNEGSPQVVEDFARRFGVEVIDAFGSTEGGVTLNRDPPVKPGALGRPGSNVKVVDDLGAERAVARFDGSGRLLNPDDCVGEIVSTAGAGVFEGYYNNPEATAATLREGWYWSGDLGYVDEDGYLYFAGRTADWIRVDGENFPAGPIEAALARHPDVVVAAVYGVPDQQAGDQVMAALVLRPGARFDGEAFAAWLDGLADVGRKWRPRYVRVAAELPATGTNKIVKRTLASQKLRRDRVGGDDLWVRERGAAAYRPFTADDEAALRAGFVAAGRERFWDL